MSFFKEAGTDEQSVRDLIRIKYGAQAQVLASKECYTGGILGLFKKRRVELTGYLKREAEPKEQKATVLENSKEAEALLKTVSAELRALKAVVQEQHEKSELRFTIHEPHPTLKHVETLLYRNEFSMEYSNEILARICSECTLEELDDIQSIEKKVLRWIAESIQFAEPKLDKQGLLCILLGPTGVGKTTSIAKLAALLGIKAAKKRAIRIITLDSYRIGAREQISIYGEIMNIPTVAVESKESFKKEINNMKDTDIVFVDTIGRSPLDCVNIAEMHELLKENLRYAKPFLCISATTKCNDLEEIIRQFDGFAPDSIILTKLDETHCVGNVISALHKKRKHLCYISTGQKVPNDIEEATLKPILARIEGFSVQPEEIMSILEVNT